MTDQTNLVQGEPNPVGSVEPLPDAQDGVSSTEGMAPQTPSDAEKLAAENAKLANQLTAMQKDMDKMRSTYDRRVTETERQYQDRLEKAATRLDEAMMAQLEGEDRIAYELQRERERRQAAEQRAEQTRIALEEQQQLLNYRAYFTELGLDQSKIDYSSLETMGATAFPAIAEMVKELKSPKPPNPVDPSSTLSGIQTPPKTATPTPLIRQHGQVPSGPTTVPQLLDALTKQLGYTVTENDIGRLIAQGVLDESIFGTLDPDKMY